jgi:hypothetical protein
MIVLNRCHDLAVHHDHQDGRRGVVLEYASEGRVVPTGASYTNRYISVLRITDRKVTHWRDYLDPLAVFDALGWPSRGWPRDPGEAPAPSRMLYRPRLKPRDGPSVSPACATRIKGRKLGC